MRRVIKADSLETLLRLWPELIPLTENTRVKELSLVAAHPDNPEKELEFVFSETATATEKSKG